MCTVASAWATTACSRPNSSLTRLSTAAVSAMPQAVSGTILASCGQGADEAMATTISMMTASENAGAAPNRALAPPTSRHWPIKVTAICDSGRYSAQTTQARMPSTRPPQPAPAVKLGRDEQIALENRADDDAEH